MNTSKKQCVTLLATTLITLLAGQKALAGNLINNGDFEKIDYLGRYTIYNSATVPDEFGWSISNDFVYLVNSFWNGVSGTTNLDGFDQSIELRPNLLLSQTFATQVGQQYDLSLWYAHDPSNQRGSAIGHVNVQGSNLLLSNTLLHNIPSTRANLNFSQYLVQFTADSDSTTLSLQGDPTNGLHGFVIDGVSVFETPDSATVPEPSLGFGLLIFGIFGASFVSQKNKSHL